MRRAICLMGVGALLGGAGCTAASRSTFERQVAQVLVSDEQESQLGLRVRQELSRQGITWVNEPEVKGYVQQLALPILRAANTHRAGVPWTVSVINDAQTVNAFATPGGYLYVYTGLLLACDNEAELAGVLGHEAAHVTARHSARQLVNTYGLSAIAKLALGENPGLLQELTASIVARGMLLANSRADESEADEWGMGYAYEAGFDPHGIAWFFEKLHKSQGDAPEFLTWLSTHPAPKSRVAAIQGFIDARGLGEGRKDSAEFQRVKARLKESVKK